MAEITLQIPEDLYEQLINKAATFHQPVNVVACNPCGWECRQM